MQDALAKSLGGSKRKKCVRFFVAALSGIPWVGGVIGAAAGLSAEKDQEQINDLHRLWLAQHEKNAADPNDGPFTQTIPWCVPPKIKYPRPMQPRGFTFLSAVVQPRVL